MSYLNRSTVMRMVVPLLTAAALTGCAVYDAGYYGSHSYGYATHGVGGSTVIYDNTVVVPARPGYYYHGTRPYYHAAPPRYWSPPPRPAPRPHYGPPGARPNWQGNRPGNHGAGRPPQQGQRPNRPANLNQPFRPSPSPSRPGGSLQPQVQPGSGAPSGAAFRTGPMRLN